MKRAQAVFLDRDGVINAAVVINGKPYPPKTISSLKILDGVEQALANLRCAGWLLIVVTNQPDVARGTAEKKDIEDINAYLSTRLPIDQFLTCYHDTVDRCMCRKPSPGMLYSASEEHKIDLCKSYMVGDRWRDIEAGKRAGCNTIFIDYGYKEIQPLIYDYKVSSLLIASQIILGENNEKY